MTAPLAKGDPAVVLARGVNNRTSEGAILTVEQVTPSLIVTDDGRRWNLAGRWPVGGGRNSRLRLHSLHDDEAVAARAHMALRTVAYQADNLERLNRTDPHEVAADLAAIARAATDARLKVIGLITEASRARTLSDR